MTHAEQRALPMHVTVADIAVPVAAVTQIGGDALVEVIRPGNRAGSVRRSPSPVGGCASVKAMVVIWEISFSAAARAVTRQLLNLFRRGFPHSPKNANFEINACAHTRANRPSRPNQMLRTLH
jgi:hypothetical protein